PPEHEEHAGDHQGEQREEHQRDGGTQADGTPRDAPLVSPDGEQLGAVVRAPLVSTNGPWKSAKVRIVERSRTTSSTGRSIGSVMLVNCCQRVAPSTRAAS